MSVSGMFRSVAGKIRRALRQEGSTWIPLEIQVSPHRKGVLLTIQLDDKELLIAIPRGAALQLRENIGIVVASDGSPVDYIQ